MNMPRDTRAVLAGGSMVKELPGVVGAAQAPGRRKDPAVEGRA